MQTCETIIGHQDTVLLVGAERDKRGFLAANLTADGYEALEVGSAEGARRLLTQSVVDLMVIDGALPDGDGLELVQFVRGTDQVAPRVDSNLPIIVASDRAALLDRVRGFERGCDDYLPRPYAYTEMRARIAALLRRRRRLSLPSRLRVGALEVDGLARQAWVDGKPLRLSSKEFSLLHAFAREPGRVFSRAELMELVWGWADGAHGARQTRTLDSHISRLRRKLGLLGVHYIVNVWAVGYRLIDLTATLPAEEQQAVA